jgi:hypothetical protein
MRSGLPGSASWPCCSARRSPQARRQRPRSDVGNPLEHFLAKQNAGGQRHTVDDPVLRIGEDFRHDGLIDVALWQPHDLGDGAGPMFLYMQRQDGRFPASGSVIADAKRLFRVAPAEPGMARRRVCGRRGYEASEFVVTELSGDGPTGVCPCGAPRRRASGQAGSSRGSGGDRSGKSGGKSMGQEVSHNQERCDDD